MSESATNVHIEDVLSSIRRLVTEEGRDTPSRAAQKTAEKSHPRLVLTEALRVEPEPDADQDDRVEMEPEADLAEPFHLSPEFSAPEDNDEIMFHKPAASIDPEAPWSTPDVTLHEAAAIAEERLAEDDDEPEALSYEAEAEPLWDAASFEESEAPDADIPENWDKDVLDDRAETSEEETPEPTEEAHFKDVSDEDLLADSDLSIETEIAPVVEIDESAVLEQDTDLVSEQPDTVLAEADDLDTDAPEEHWEEYTQASDAVSEPEVEQAPDPEHLSEAPAQSPVDNRTATLSAKIQALEAAIAQTEDQWEPDGSTRDDDYAAMPLRTIPWQDDTSQDTEATYVSGRAEPEMIEVETAEPETDDAEANEDAVLDEDALRTLVADIVRQELQGVLGERITRNVRKLVRREIHRALTAQELD